MSHTSRLNHVLLTALIACTLTSAASGQSTAQAPAPGAAKTAAPSDARKAMDKLKAMAGSWRGAIMDIPMSVTIRPVSSRTAVLHEMTADGKSVPQQEITMIYVEDDRLFAIHYCDGGNRVRLEGKLSPDETAIDFTMLDVAGGTKGGLLKRIAFTQRGADLHVMEGTFVMPDGKSIDLRGEFQRR